MADRILVTGGTGFIAGHTILALLNKGYEVRASMRSLTKADGLKATLAQQGGEVDRLSAVEADLTADAGWTEAAEGCQGIFHMASPFPLDMPKDPEDIIRPAVDGTKRVLNAALAADVPRVVLTSSLVAVSYGRGGRESLFTEADWTDPEGQDVNPYVQSKTLAEKAAWEIADGARDRLTLSTVNPGVVLGPLLSAGHGTSVELVRKMMAGELPGAPRAGFGVVDVRDVADLHVRAFEAEAAKGERFICADSWMWLSELGRAIKAHYPQAGRKAPTRELPSWLVRLFARVDPSVKQVLIELDQKRAADNAKAKSVLGWSPRPADEAVHATCESLIAFDLV